MVSFIHTKKPRLHTYSTGCLPRWLEGEQSAESSRFIFYSCQSSKRRKLESYTQNSSMLNTSKTTTRRNTLSYSARSKIFSSCNSNQGWFICQKCKSSHAKIR